MTNEEAIELLKNMHWSITTKMNREVPSSLALLMAIEALKGKDIDVPTKWIPVTEELPKEKGEYLVTYHPCCWDNVGKEKRVGMDTFKGKTSWAKNKYQRVTAWMKKPDPWEGE